MEQEKQYLSENMKNLLFEKMGEKLKTANMYKCMYYWLEYNQYTGFASMFKRMYRNKYYDYEKIEMYLLRRCVKPYVPEIPEMNHDFGTIKNVLTTSKELLEASEESYNKIYLECFKENDFATINIVNDFINSLVEEISKIKSCIDKLELVGDNEQALFILDSEYKCDICES